jgi:hypothetical protein
MKFTISINEATQKLKQNTVLLKTPLSYEKDDVWKEIYIILPDMSRHGGYSAKYFTIKKDKVIAIHPELAKKFNIETVGEIQPETEKALEKARIKLEKELKDVQNNKDRARIVVFQMTINSNIAKLKDPEKGEAIVTKYINDKTRSPFEKVVAIESEIAKLEKKNE